MKHGQLHACMICLLFFLPACGPTVKKTKKEKSQQQIDVAGSFVNHCEEEIRKAVRQEYCPTVTKSASQRSCRRLSKKQRRVAARQWVRSQEAKLADIPIPLQSEPIEDFFDSENPDVSPSVTLGYKTDMSSEQLTKFYQQEMDRHGWRCISEVAGKETLTSFVKPARVCFVSIRPRYKNRSNSIGSNCVGSDFVISTGPTVTTTSC